ncbi:tachykinins isoform X1 [Frieseomelitta varia]|uniref:tachykinins isoform X1 n=1 Tax=Frieseomelitta varia TaxID=561572 RepID=UPI001CB68989|nr:tachykinins isoform X1 [Frieseomelitta varia]
MIIRSTFLLMVSFTFAIAEESSDALSDKRGAMGFQGMRGKKSFDTLDPDDFGVLKRAIMGFQGMRGKKNSIITDVADELFSEETNKRAPMGFQGMRGKKALLDDEYYKRAPMGFQGMRGKKSLEEILDQIKKKATTRFQDPRGQDVYLIDYPEDYEKRVLSMDGFSNVFDKKDEFPWEKRAPMGFQGTRGKKSILDTWENLDKPSLIDLHDFERRKDTIDDYLDYSINPSDYDTRAADFQDIENSGSPFKRARMGFHGMRGKRNAGEIYGFNSSTAGTTIGYQGVPNLAVYEIEKRSPFRYLGVRGKKNPRWEFRGKFVGVRGKKASTLQAVF